MCICICRCCLLPAVWCVVECCIIAALSLCILVEGIISRFCTPHIIPLMRASACASHRTRGRARAGGRPWAVQCSGSEEQHRILWLGY
jgi:hypothetical protein